MPHEANRKAHRIARIMVEHRKKWREYMMNEGEQPDMNIYELEMKEALDAYEEALRSSKPSQERRAKGVF